MQNYIVYIYNYTMHSAWTSKEDAESQKNVLIEYGYKLVHIEPFNHNYKNGHYFI